MSRFWTPAKNPQFWRRLTSQVAILALTACQTTSRSREPSPSFSGWSPAAQKIARYRETSAATQQSSVAVITTLLNCARSARVSRPLTFTEVLATDPTGHWRAATSLEKGRGLDLEMLGLVTLRAFWASGLRQVGVDASPCSLTSFSETLASFRFALTQHAQRPHQIFVVLHNNDAEGRAQNTLVADFNEKRDQVLLFDFSEKSQFWAWSSVETVLQQMRRPSCLAGRGCGYITVRLGR